MKSQEAKCSQEIRRVLKKEFPKTKFKVLKGYLGVDVSWENGETEEQVYNLLAYFRRGQFDSMHDIYVNDNINKRVAQVDYIGVKRTISEDIFKKALDAFKCYYSFCVELDESLDERGQDEAFTPRRQINYKLRSIDLNNIKEIKTKLFLNIKI